jgi:hypothetical protein
MIFSHDVDRENGIQGKSLSASKDIKGGEIIVQTYLHTISNLSIEIKQTDEKGQGVFATKNFSKGEIVIIGKPLYQLEKRTWQSLQVDVDIHVRMDQHFELVNHSCAPNCGLKTNEFNGYNLVAIKDIEVGEEVTFDYCMSEWISIAVKSCSCKSNICRKTIRGGKFLSPELLKKYEGYLAPFYEQLITGSASK